MDQGGNGVAGNGATPTPRAPRFSRLALGHFLETLARAIDSLRPVLLSADELAAAVRGYYAARPNEWAVADDLDPEEADWAAESFPRGGRVLVLFAGGGREMLGLARRGWRVEGVEWIPAAAARARERLARAGVDARVHEQDLRALDLGEGGFDGATALGITYGMIPGRAVRVDVLRRIARALRPGGRLLLDALIAAPSARERRLFPVRRALARALGGNAGYQLGDRPRPGGGFMHFFADAQEIAAEMAEAGWRVVRSEAVAGDIVLLAAEAGGREGMSR